MVLNSSLLIVSSLVLVIHALPAPVSSSAEPYITTQENRGIAQFISVENSCIMNEISLNPELYVKNGTPQQSAAYDKLAFSCSVTGFPHLLDEPNAQGATPQKNPSKAVGTA